MTVLVAGTETAAGRAAYRYAIEEARRRGEDLTYFALEGGEHEPSPDLDGVSERVVGPQQRSEDPVGDLLDHAQAEDVSVIAIGVRNRSAVAKLILGSAAQQIILEATAPVVCVKA